MNIFSARDFPWMGCSQLSLWTLPLQQERNWGAAGETKPAAGKLCSCLENQDPFLFLPALIGISLFWFDSALSE